MPDGTKFEGVGIQPDIEIKMSREHLYQKTDIVLERTVAEAKKNFKGDIEKEKEFLMTWIISRMYESDDINFLLSLSTIGCSQELKWSSFEWISYSAADRIFERAAILIPLKLRHTPRMLWSQLDTGPNATTAYEIPFKQLKYPAETPKDQDEIVILSGIIGHYSFDGARFWKQIMAKCKYCRYQV